MQALQRVLRAARDRIDRAIELLLEWWRRIWSRAPQDDGEPEPLHGGPGMPLVATAVVAIASLVPWAHLVGVAPALVGAAAVVVWFVLLFWLLSACRGEPSSQFELFLAGVERRTGLVRFERFGLLVSVISFIAVLDAPALVPVPLLAFVSFLVIMGRRYEARVLGPVRPELGPGPDTSDPSAWEPREFAWTVDRAGLREDGRATVQVELARYRTMREANEGRGPIAEIPRWVTDGSGSEVDEVARAVLEIVRTHNLSSFREVCHVLAFVQSIPYSNDEETTGQADYWRFPIETIYDATGDCEDSSILACAVLGRLGQRAVLVDAPGHIAIGVQGPEGIPGSWIEHQGVRYYFCETTNEGWQVGELPPSMQGQDLAVIPIPELPRPLP